MRIPLESNFILIEPLIEDKMVSKLSQNQEKLIDVEKLIVCIKETNEVMKKHQEKENIEKECLFLATNSMIKSFRRNFKDFTVNELGEKDKNIPYVTNMLSLTKDQAISAYNVLSLQRQGLHSQNIQYQSIFESHDKKDILELDYLCQKQKIEILKLRTIILNQDKKIKDLEKEVHKLTFNDKRKSEQISDLEERYLETDQRLSAQIEEEILLKERFDRTLTEILKESAKLQNELEELKRDNLHLREDNRYLREDNLVLKEQIQKSESTMNSVLERLELLEQNRNLH